MQIENSTSSVNTVPEDNTKYSIRRSKRDSDRTNVAYRIRSRHRPTPITTTELPEVETSSQRNIRKYIRRPINSNNTRNSKNSDKNIDNSSSSDHNNTQRENGGDNSEDVSPNSPETVRVNPTRRKVIIPVRRSRLRPQPFMLPSSNPSAIESEQHETTRRRVVVTRRRVLPKTETPSLISTLENQSQLEPTPSLNLNTLSIIQSTQTIRKQPQLIDYTTTNTILDTVTRLTSKLKTFTYVVTRVHDQQSEIISTTTVREQTKTVTDTLTKTSLVTLHVPITLTSVTITPTLTDYRTTIQTTHH